jgi:hypothetical protein
VGAPSFASLKPAWNDKSDCGRKGWVSSTLDLYRSVFSHSVIPADCGEILLSDPTRCRRSYTPCARLGFQRTYRSRPREFALKSRPNRVESDSNCVESASNPRCQWQGAGFPITRDHQITRSRGPLPPHPRASQIGVGLSNFG